MSDHYPDLEIYIKRCTTDGILDWLGARFNLSETQSHKLKTSCRLTAPNSISSRMKCIILEKAVKGGYTSVWIKNNQTIWNTDRECALDAFAYFSDAPDVEIRCSTGAWRGEDEAGWLSFKADGERIVNWFK